MDQGLAIEEFIQALTTQLDRTQAAMALKARNMNLPLTFAVKDLTLDLRSHIDFADGQIRIAPVEPGQKEASIIRLVLTTITRPMVEENATEFRIQPDDVSIKEALGDTLTTEEQRRLEWAGIHTISQLEQVDKQGDQETLEKVSHLPVGRLRAALMKMSQPMIRRVVRDNPADRLRSRAVPEGDQVTQEPMPGPEASRLIRIRGRNLLRAQTPKVRIGSRPVRVIASRRNELVVDPGRERLAGVLSVETEPGSIAEYRLDDHPLDIPTETPEDAEVEV